MKKSTRTHSKKNLVFIILQIILVSILLIISDENQQKLLAHRHDAVLELQKESPDYKMALDYSKCFYDYHTELYWKLMGIFSKEEYHKESVERDIELCKEILETTSEAEETDTVESQKLIEDSNAGSLVDNDPEENVEYDYSSWHRTAYPKHSKETIEKLLSYEDIGWRKAYAEILLEYEAEGESEPWDSGWDLYDIDSSGVPELVYSTGTSAGGRMGYTVYVFHDGAAESIGSFYCYDLAACYEDSLICSNDLKQGECYNSTIKIESDHVAETHYFYTNDGVEGGDDYMVDDRNVTREEFYDMVRIPDSIGEEGKGDYLYVGFSLGEYDDIFYMGAYSGLE